MKLREILTIYQLERDVTDCTIAHLGYAIGSFERHLGREANLDDCNDDAVNAWLVWLAANGARCTVRNYRVRLLTVWRFAVEAGLFDRLPLRVRKNRLHHPTPEAWSAAEVQKLLAAVGKLRGCFRHCKVRRADYWRAVIETAYDTGLRIGDIAGLTADNFSGSMLLVRQHKTGEPIVCWVRPETLADVRKIESEKRSRIFGDVLGRRSFFERFAEIRKSAGLKGSFRWLRRTGASLVEAKSPGMGAVFLGHKSRGIAERHYFDPRLLRGRKLMPPKLG